MNRTVTARNIILGVSLCTLGATLLYIYFKTRDDEEKKTQKRKPEQSKKIAPRKEIQIQMTISNEDIPLIVGRGGANLNIIEEKTHTTIRFRDKNETQKFCDIHGYPDNVKEVRSLLAKQIERAPIFKEEISIPQNALSKIIGRCGETLQEIRCISLAKILLDSEDNNVSKANKSRIIITGSRNQVNLARKLIEEKIQEDEEYRKTIEEIEQKREPRRSPANSVSSSMYSSQTSLNMHLPSKEKLTTNGYENQMEVYVSAVASPSRFWVHIIGKQTKKLDDLVQEMTEYYSLEKNREIHHITEPTLGQIVAVVFKFDGKWYRAEIVGILPNQFNPKEKVLDLYFLDYGDSEYVSPTEVFELRTDFLTLRFQAVECFLANIKSNNRNDPDNWDQQAIQKFEEVTQVANWKKLIARVVTYSDRPKVGTRSTRESSPVPGVELIDWSDEGELNIGQMLICQGFGLSDNQIQSVDLPLQVNSAQTSRTESNENISSSPPPKQNESLSKEDQFLQQQLRELEASKSLYTNGAVEPASLSYSKIQSNGQLSASGPSIPNSNRSPANNMKQSNLINF